MSSFRDFLLNRDHSAAWALALAMTGVRMGERALMVGDDAPLFVQLAGKIGLTGHVAVVVGTAQAAAKVEAEAASAGVLVEDLQQAGLPEFRADAGTFDLAVLNAGPTFLALSQAGKATLIGNVKAALRDGGRLVVVEGCPPKFLGLVQNRTPGLPAFQSEGGATSLLEAAGFRPVRLLADREGQRFTEGMKTGVR